MRKIYVRNVSPADFSRAITVMWSVRVAFIVLLGLFARAVVSFPRIFADKRYFEHRQLLARC